MRNYFADAPLGGLLQVLRRAAGLVSPAGEGRQCRVGAVRGRRPLLAGALPSEVGDVAGAVPPRFALLALRLCDTGIIHQGMVVLYYFLGSLF